MPPRASATGKADVRGVHFAEGETEAQEVESQQRIGQDGVQATKPRFRGARMQHQLPEPPNRGMWPPLSALTGRLQTPQGPPPPGTHALTWTVEIWTGGALVGVAGRAAMLVWGWVCTWAWACIWAKACWGIINNCPFSLRTRTIPGDKGDVASGDKPPAHGR